jgi:hypothetical protein
LFGGVTTGAEQTATGNNMLASGGLPNPPNPTGICWWLGGLGPPAGRADGVVFGGVIAVHGRDGRRGRAGGLAHGVRVQASGTRSVTVGAQRRHAVFGVCWWCEGVVWPGMAMRVGLVRAWFWGRGLGWFAR